MILCCFLVMCPLHANEYGLLIRMAMYSIQDHISKNSLMTYHIAPTANKFEIFH